jgi:hypothetical protein
MKSTLLAVVLFPVLLCASRPSNAGDEDVLRSIVDGYRANRDSFRFMTCRSIVAQGKAESIEKALAGDYLPGDRIVAQGFYAKQGRIERTDLIYPSELQEKFKVQASDHTFTTSFVSERQLGDGRLLAVHFPDNSQANIGERERNWLSYNLVRPFDMGLNGRNEMMALDTPAPLFGL